ncbi:hypothetical protein COCON_G00136240 [Conger conger]|uniref:Retinoic acid receptor responder protein 2 n=1 Tax=Conger conger TaxID=82655 RepID=A0A9Q1HXT1_CONCO|nr:hypothetical protein COCON_G00136240 [Conger conger]
MSCQLLFLLLTVGACVSSTEGRRSYDQLPDRYKKGVDLAREHLLLYGSFPYHLLFVKSLNASAVETGFGGKYIYHNFDLKATTCSNDTVDPDPKRCPFRDDRTLINCAVCYKIFSGKVQKVPMPYVTCAHKPFVTQEQADKRFAQCTKMFERASAYIRTLLQQLFGANSTLAADHAGSQD